MDRIALSKRLEGLSSVFAGESKISRDLKAMAYVLTNMPEEKFAEILSPDYTADAAMTPQEEAQFEMMKPNPQGGYMIKGKPVGRGMARGRGPGFGEIGKNIIIMAPPEKKAQVQKLVEQIRGIIEPEPVSQAQTSPMKLANEEENVEGAYWNKQASSAVLNNLLREVTGMEKVIPFNTGRKLTPEQTPDAKHKGIPETPPTLKKEQTPDESDVLKSDMVAKSKKAPVKKEAGSIKGPGKPDGTGPMSGTPECPMSKEKKEEEEKSAACGKKHSGEEEGEMDKDADQNAPGGSQNNPNPPAEKLLKEKGMDKDAGVEEIKKQKAEKEEEKAEDLGEKAQEDILKAKKTLEKSKEKEEKAEELMPEEKPEEKPEKEEKDASSYTVGGIEFISPMEDISLDDKEADHLSQLFK